MGQKLDRINISKEYLLEEYVEKQRSSRQIAKELGCDKSVVLWRLREFGIHARPFRRVCQDGFPTKSARYYHNHKSDTEWVSRQRESNKRSLGKFRSKYRKNMREDRLLFQFSYKAQVGCSVCGETDPIVLQFHHRDRENKLFTIGQTGSRERNNGLLMKEIEKCDVLCANCHARETWEQAHK